MKKPTCPFGKEVTAAEHIARAEWEAEQVDQLQQTKPRHWEILASAHARVALLYLQEADKLTRKGR